MKNKLHKMNLEESVKDIILIDIAREMSFVNFDNEARDNLNMIRFVYRRGLVTDEELDSAIAQGLERTARWQFDRMRKQHIWPDHLYPTEIFAYGIEKVFTPSEILKIKFDHGDNPIRFMKEYGKPDIVEDYRKRLLNPPYLKILESDAHCVCRA